MEFSTEFENLNQRFHDLRVSVQGRGGIVMMGDLRKRNNQIKHVKNMIKKSRKGLKKLGRWRASALVFKKHLKIFPQIRVRIYETELVHNRKRRAATEWWKDWIVRKYGVWRLNFFSRIQYHRLRLTIDMEENKQLLQTLKGEFQVVMEECSKLDNIPIMSINDCYLARDLKKKFGYDGTLGISPHFSDTLAQIMKLKAEQEGFKVYIVPNSRMSVITPPDRLRPAWDDMEVEMGSTVKRGEASSSTVERGESSTLPPGFPPGFPPGWL